VLKLDGHGYSPTTLYHILYATAEVKSHNKAAKLLDVLDDVSISGRHVNRLAEAIGLEMAAQRDRAVEDFVHHRRQPPTAAAPEVAVIGLDGGRVRTRASGQGTGVHGQGWKEDKVACLQAMQGATFSADPHPEPLTSSLGESLIKEVNYRVKGTEKFWDNPEGAEAILQLRAAVLSDDNRLQTFIRARPGSATHRHQETEHRQAA
jgi:hypothetical protein